MAITGMFLSRGLTLGLYDFVKTFALKDPANTSLLTKFLIANAVTQSVNICLYPLDTVGRLLMMQSGSKTKLYKNPLCFLLLQRLQRSHGVAPLYNRLANANKRSGAAESQGAKVAPSSVRWDVTSAHLV